MSFIILYLRFFGKKKISLLWLLFDESIMLARVLYYFAFQEEDEGE